MNDSTTTRSGKLLRLGIVPAAIAVAVALIWAGTTVGAPLTRARDAAQAPTGHAMLRAEIEAMTEAGMASDDPKVLMLENELAALEALADAEPVPEPGIRLADITESGARLERPDADEQWEDGPVECEPLPGLVTADEVADAHCRVEPQPGGGARYVITAPDGDERAIPFGHNLESTPPP